MSAIYTYEMLKQMKGQAVKDIWHNLIGKPAGIKNTTGLRNSEEIIQAILKKQGEYQEDMPRKPKTTTANPIVLPPKTIVQAVEADSEPITRVEVKRIRVHKLYVGNNEYFLDEQTKEVFSVEGQKPGQKLGIWNPETKCVSSS